MKHVVLGGVRLMVWGTSALDLAVREEGGQLLLEVLASGTAILFR